MKYFKKIHSFLLSAFAVLLFTPSLVSAATLTNPIAYTTVYEFVRAMLGVVVRIGVLVLGIMIVYSGFLFVTAQGNTQKLEEAKKSFIWVVIGGAIVLGAWGLSLAIADVISVIAPTGP